MLKIIRVLTLIFISLLALELGIRAGGFLYQKGSKNIKAKTGSIRVLAIGESTTEMGGVHSYPRLLEEELQRFLPDYKISVINGGVGGTTTDLVSARIKDLLIKHQPEFVTLMLGVNDGPTTIIHKERLSSTLVLLLKSLKLYQIIDFLLLKAQVVESKEITSKNAITVNYWKSINNSSFQFFLDFKNAYNKRLLSRTEFLTATKNEVLGEIAALITLKKIPKAKEYIEKAITRFPKSPVIHSIGLFFYYEWEKSLQTRKALDKIYNKNFKDVGSLYAMSYFLQKKGQFEKAISLLDKAIVLEPSYGPAYLLKSEIRKHQNNSEEAITILEESLDKVVDEDNLMFLLEWYLERSRLKEFEDKIRVAEKFFPGSIELNYYKSRYFIIEGREFIENKTLEIDNFKSYAIELDRICTNAWILSDKMRYEDSDKLLFDAIKTFPNEEEKFYSILAINSLRRNDKSTAENYFSIIEHIASKKKYFVTYQNYNKIIKQIREYNSIPIAVEYALRPGDIMLENFEKEQQILRIQNSNLFRDALVKYKFKDLFIDAFGCSFGHATKWGNTIIAKSIAKELIPLIKNTRRKKSEKRKN